jgi:uncharacterized membrane protein YhaH (DUF805 family)
MNMQVSVTWPLRDWLPNLFGFTAPVGQRQYAGFGLSLMALKYAVEAMAILGLTGKVYTPLDFVNPLLSAREKFTADAPLWLGMAWVLWTLPFLWIALTMSVRRAAALNLSPWWGLLVLAPVVNLVCMAALACISDSFGKPLSAAEIQRNQARDAKLAEAYAPPLTDPFQPKDLTYRSPTHPLVAALVGLAGGAGFLVLVVVGSVYLFDSYGAVMFFGTPVVTGAIASYCLNAPVPRSIALTLGHGLLTLTTACVAFLVFGLEGAICILMAIPIMVPLGLLGTLMGYAIALGMRSGRQHEYPGLFGAVLLLPLLGMAESWWQTSPRSRI